jgi:hypothetical protein
MAIGQQTMPPQSEQQRLRESCTSLWQFYSTGLSKKIGKGWLATTPASSATNSRHSPVSRTSVDLHLGILRAHCHFDNWRIL